jgi:hypothetical protein
MAFDPSFILNGLGNAKDPKAGRDPFPLTGEHEFAIVNVFMKPTKKFGLSVAVDLHCVKSDNPAMVVGSKYQTLFRVSMNSPNGFEQDEELARMKQFCNATTGHPLSDAVQAQKTAATFLAPSNAGRGFLVKCRGWKGSKSEFVNYEWQTVQGQSGETHKAIRAQMDAKYPTVAQAVTAPAPTPPPAAAPSAPAPAGGGLDLSSLGL